MFRQDMEETEQRGMKKSIIRGVASCLSVGQLVGWSVGAAVNRTGWS